MLHLLLIAQDAADRGVVEDIGKTVKVVDEVQHPDFVWKMTLTICATFVVCLWLVLKRRKR